MENMKHNAWKKRGKKGENVKKERRKANFGGNAWKIREYVSKRKYDIFKTQATNIMLFLYI